MQYHATLPVGDMDAFVAKPLPEQNSNDSGIRF
jgi:hypothetical protein